MRVANYQPLRGDGRLACQLDAQKHWQSHMTVAGRVAPLPALTDINELARMVRAAQTKETQE